ncbi:uncharacterized protein LOC134752726 isoform X2 [Cydia strobilella]|uniref:uncharacterized protein LOC134752726 isoform X2 n=1 Tax=Cydia strobilella TaxID=1100964 RepID=UPI0030053262
MEMWKFDKISFGQAHMPREDSGGSMAMEARVKEETHDQVSDHALIKREAEFTDEEMHVKKELLSLGNECKISEAAMLAELYKDHIVKGELVLGPEHPHQPDVMLVVHGWASADADGCPDSPALERVHRPELVLRDCYVRLERLRNHEALASHDVTPMNTTIDTNKYYTEDKISTKLFSEKKGKELISETFGSFVSKSDLKKHAKKHIQKSSMKKEKDKHCVAGRDKNKTFSGGRKQKSARERASSKQLTLRECFVRIARLPHHALLRCNMRPPTRSANLQPRVTQGSPHLIHQTKLNQRK